MKIGIFGGSFNPPHNMHKKIALELIEKRYVDQVIFVPTGKKYPKKGLIDDKERYQMLSLMTESYDNLSVSDYEMKNNLTYTYQTLAHFKKEYRESEIYFICGGDNLEQMTTWKNYEEILDNYKIIVMERGERRVLDQKEYQNIIIAPLAPSNLSSTKIRDLMEKGQIEEVEKEIDYKVLEYIKRKNLYGK